MASEGRQRVGVLQAGPGFRPLTLEGIVVGLDTLTDGLLQVPLLYTLDPQVLEAESPTRHQSHGLCPGCPPPPTHEITSVLYPLEWLPPVLQRNPTPYFGRKAPVPCDPALATVPAGSLPSAIVASCLFSKHAKLTPTLRPLHVFTLLGMFFPCFFALSHYSSLK